MQALDLLRLQGDRRISPAEGDVRMVSFGFRQISSTLYEGKRLCKILKLKCSLDPLISVEDSPFRGVAMMGFHLVFIERRDAAPAGSTRFVNEGLWLRRHQK